VGRRRHLAYIVTWTVVFIAMSAAEGVGDTHRGQRITFWMKACSEGRPNGCRHAALLASIYCTGGSGWACNEYGVLLQPARRPDVAGRSFRRACDLGFAAGCDNLDPARAESPVHAPPQVTDYRIVLRGRKGPLPGLTPLQLYQRACAQGFSEGCRQACAEGDTSLCGRADGP
jgi:TPR repeat protein